MKRLRVVYKKVAGADLSSRDPAVQVLSALMSLTSVFGMGTGVTSPSLAPALYNKPFRRATKPLCFVFVVTRMGIEPMLPA